MKLETYPELRKRRNPDKKNIKELPREQVAGQLWLNIDDVLKILPIKRQTLWLMLKNEQFPKPYYHGRIPLWSQAQVREHISDLVGGVVKQKSDKTPITWDSVKKLLKDKSPTAFTNQQIAHHLDADMQDTTMLTRMMAKAGEIKVFSPLRHQNGTPLFYVYLETS